MSFNEPNERRYGCRKVSTGKRESSACDDRSSQEWDRKNIPSSLCVGLEVALPVAGASGNAGEPQHEGGEVCEQEQDFETMGVGRARIAKRLAPSMIFEIAECFFDLHPGCIGADHAAAGVSRVRQ